MSQILNQLIWENDLAKLNDILEQFKSSNRHEVDYIQSLDEWDLRGNPPLHLALMLGRTEAVRLLLSAGASCTSVNAHDSDALDEAICLGDRDLLFRIIEQYAREKMEKLLEPRGPWSHLNEHMPEFYMEIQVKLKSPVPLLAKLCPKETVKIWKRPDGLRIDWSICKIVGTKVQRAPMSFVLHIKDQDQVVAFLLNREQKVAEELFPNISKSLLHDLVENYLKHGTRTDEAPIPSYQWEPVPATVLSKFSKKTLGKTKYKVEIFTLSKMTWIQRLRIPYAQTFYDACTAECRTRTQRAPAIGQKKPTTVQSLEALQFLSESEIKLEFDAERRDSMAEDDLIKAEKLIINGKDDGGEAGEEDLQFIETVLRRKLPRLFGKNKLRRQQSVMSVRSVFQKANPIKDEEPLEAELESNRLHIRSFAPPEIPLACFEEYFGLDTDKSSATMYVGRECHHSTYHYQSTKNLMVYLSRDIPLRLQHLVPLLEWITQGVLSTDELQAFINQNSRDAFPVRFDLQLFSMLACRATISKFETKCTIPEGSYDIPSDYEPGEILPLIEINDI